MKKNVVLILLLIVFSTLNGQNLVNKSDKKPLKVAMMLPLFYEKIDELSFNQYNINDKQNVSYKCFSYISFYEGARIALDELERNGYKVSLYVFDVGEDDVSKVEKALRLDVMKDMDLVVPLVFKNGFEKISGYCQQHKIPIINPMSADTNILANPYVVKIQPDVYAMNNCLMKYIEQKQQASKLIIIYDDKNTNMHIVNEWKAFLMNSPYDWTMINYRKNANKLKSYISTSKNNFVINLTDKLNGRENRAYAQELVNKLLQSKCKVTLFAKYEWIDYIGNDYKQLQSLDFHFALSYYNDYTNANFVDFVKSYRQNFKTEPDKIYAALGYDLMKYFIPLFANKNTSFADNITNKDMSGMIQRYRFVRSSENKGWQNTNATIYKLDNYKIKSQWNY